MNSKVGNKRKGVDFTGAPAARAAGRLAIWVAIGLLIFRGGLSILESPRDAAPAGHAAASLASPASEALAVGFARAYLAHRSPRSLTPFLAEGARIGRGRTVPGRGGEVTQAAVSGIENFGGGRTVLTVACELRDGRALYLAVPISRSGAGEVAVTGAPWVVAAPSTAGVVAERPRPLAGPEAGAIRALAAKFLPAYLSARSARDLSYLLAPGASVTPLAGELEPVASAGSVAQLGDGEGRGRVVVVTGRFRDAATGTVYRLAYRLRVVRRSRWYVEAVEGGLS
ncbi:MAG TPA: conjugal transfer protein [Solirubrobacterales bacterium]|nr:conjugal transfer protein [Solirubrobacterales bacterium]